jgi:hypothetical protein
MQLTPTTKLLKSLSGQILPSERIFHLIPIKVDETKVYLSFYVFEIWEFSLLIGHPIERLLHQGRKGSINVSLMESINLSIPITRSLHVKTELSPEQDPMEEIMAASPWKLSTNISKKVPRISSKTKKNCEILSL